MPESLEKKVSRNGNGNRTVRGLDKKYIYCGNDIDTAIAVGNGNGTVLLLGVIVSVTTSD